MIPSWPTPWSWEATVVPVIPMSLPSRSTTSGRKRRASSWPGTHRRGFAPNSHAPRATPRADRGGRGRRRSAEPSASVSPAHGGGKGVSAERRRYGASHVLPPSAVHRLRHHEREWVSAKPDCRKKRDDPSIITICFPHGYEIHRQTMHTSTHHRALAGWPGSGQGAHHANRHRPVQFNCGCLCRQRRTHP